MLSKKNRIARSDLLSIQGSGAPIHSPHLTLRVMNSADGKPLQGKRFAFSVSKKALKRAAERNTARRRGYSVLQDLLPMVKNPFIGMFSVKAAATPLSYDVLRQEIGILLRKAGALGN